MLKLWNNYDEAVTNTKTDSHIGWDQTIDMENRNYLQRDQPHLDHTCMIRGQGGLGYVSFIIDLNMDTLIKELDNGQSKIS